MTGFANVLRTAAAAMIVVVCSSEASAQSARASHFARTRSGSVQAVDASAAARRGRAVERTAASTRSGADPLAPYTSKSPVGTYVAAPAERPSAPIPVARNYYPTARTGQYQSQPVQAGHHCTPSRGAVYARGR